MTKNPHQHSEGEVQLRQGAAEFESKQTIKLRVNLISKFKPEFYRDQLSELRLCLCLCII